MTLSPGQKLQGFMEIYKIAKSMDISMDLMYEIAYAIDVETEAEGLTKKKLNQLLKNGQVENSAIRLDAIESEISNDKVDSDVLKDFFTKMLNK